MSTNEPFSLGKKGGPIHVIQIQNQPGHCLSVVEIKDSINKKPSGKVATLDNLHQLFLSSIAALNQGLSSTVSPTQQYRCKLNMKAGHCLEGQEGKTAKQQSAA